MSDSESSTNEQELVIVNMATPERQRKGGCCRRHPVACGVTLLVVAAVSLSVLATALGIRSYLDQTFRETVDKVRTNANTHSLCIHI